MRAEEARDTVPQAASIVQMPDNSAVRSRRVSPATLRSSVQLALAWLLVLIPLAGFVELAEDVAEREIFPFDKPVMLWLHERSTTALDAVMQVVTELGGVVAVPVVAVLLAVVFLVTKRMHAAVVLAASVVGSALFNVVLKVLFKRSRPDFWQHLVVEDSWSFPSGHAMASATLALACIAVGWRTRWRWPLVLAGVLYVLAVGASRMYLGVHYPSDVLAGWCAGAAWVAAVVAVTSSRRRQSTTPGTQAVR